MNLDLPSPKLFKTTSLVETLNNLKKLANKPTFHS